jgi:hypothetical protein
MGRYLWFWEEEPARMTADVQERLAMGKAMMQSILQGIEAGKIKEWGAMLGGNKGFGVYEGSEVEVATFMQQFGLGFRHEVHAVLSARQVAEYFDSFTQ